jgi:hypothetical protein
MRGRKGLTPKVAEKICRFLHRCPNITLAFQSVGLDRDCYYYWKAKAAESDDEDNEYVRFIRDTDAALAEWMADKVYSIERAGEDDPRNWTAHAWLLERMRPDVFGRKDRHELTGAEGGPILNLDVRSLSDDEIERLRQGESASLVLRSRGGIPPSEEG